MNLIKRLSWLPSLLVIAGLMLVASCKEDEKPKSGISFATPGDEISESDGSLESFHPQLINGATGTEYEVTLLLDRPLTETAIIAYKVEGTATRNSAFELGDFEIEGNYDYITIGPGATQATITIHVFEDFSVEPGEELDFLETIVLTLESVVSGPVSISPNAQTVFTLTINEDDALVFLNWPTGNGVDMDMFLWLDDPSTPEEDYDNVNSSTAPSTDGEDGELLSIPAGFPDGTYGLSYTYYSGTSDNLNFTAEIVNFGGSLNGGSSQLSFNGNYSTANINKWDDPDDPTHKGTPLIAQTLDKSSFNFTDISNILITPADGSSRIKQHQMSSVNTARGKSIDSEVLKKYLERLTK